MNTQNLEFSVRKQPATIELYVKKIKDMDPRTLAKYESRWNTFLQKNKDLSFISKLEQIVADVISDASNLRIRPATFRVYKAVICYGLATTYIKLDNDLIDDEELEDGLNHQSISNLYRLLHPVNSVLAASYAHPARTSSTKLKYFPEHFFSYLSKLNSSLDVKTTKRFRLMFDFVSANLVVGARPIEWLELGITSNIEKKCLELFVKNSKFSHGRANGEVRCLLLENASIDQEKAILNYYIAFQNHLADVLSSAVNNKKTNSENHIFNYIIDGYEPSAFGHTPKSEIYNKYMVPQQTLAEYVLNSLQNEMFLQFNTYRSLSPKNIEKLQDHRVSLYSTRHQCIANAKASKTDIYEIAAFFGHSSIETASRHYGKAWSGWSNFTFKPSIESIRAVNGSEAYFGNEISLHQAIVPVIPDSDLDFTLRH